MAEVSHVLITGATGFVGRSLVAELVKQRFSVSAICRNTNVNFPNSVNAVKMPDFNDIKNWQAVLKPADVVVHAAGRAHITDKNAASSLAEFRRVNTVLTLQIARHAAEAGVKRFIFISSIKVNGEMTDLNKPFKSDDQFIPDDPYGLSKYEAEQGLLKLVRETDMEVVIIRPPLVYGPGVKANFASMMKWVNKGIPLPFGAVHNKRSLLALENLVSFIIHCIDHPKAANEIFLISDGEDVSTTQLLRKVAKAMGLKIKLVPVPVSWMRFTAKLLGKQAMADRLFGSLQVDSSKARKLLGWQPVISMDKQLRKMVLN